MENVGETPSNKAYDKYYNTTVFALADTCDDLDMGEMGKLVTQVFAGIRYVVVLASKSKMPGDIQELGQYLTPITEPVGEVRKLRLARDFDPHQKAILEMLVCVSWVTCRPPDQLPAPFVKECIGSSDFWSNRIRKDYKGKDDDKAKLQLSFCDNVKKVLEGLVSYIEEFHKTGLEFNPKGVSLAEAAIRMTDNPLQDAAIEANRKKDQQSNKKAQDLGTTVKGANMAGLVSELANRVNDDGSSAATGLRKVRRGILDIVRLLISLSLFPSSWSVPLYLPLTKLVTILRGNYLPNLMDTQNRSLRTNRRGGRNLMEKRLSPNLLSSHPPLHQRNKSKRRRLDYLSWNIRNVVLNG
jgi:hypothetical protein